MKIHQKSSGVSLLKVKKNELDLKLSGLRNKMLK